MMKLIYKIFRRNVRWSLYGDVMFVVLTFRQQYVILITHGQMLDILDMLLNLAWMQSITNILQSLTLRGLYLIILIKSS